MKKIITGFLIILSSNVTLASTVINFDNLSSGTPVGASYSGLGVTFINAEAFSSAGLPGGLPGASAPMAIMHSSLFEKPQPSSPISALF